MNKKLTLKQFISEVKRSNGNFEEIASLAIMAILGHNCCCPHEDSECCSNCNSHNVQIVKDVIVRVNTQKRQICCVEWPMLKDEPGQLISWAFVRCQIRHCVGQLMLIGTITDLGSEIDTKPDSMSIPNLFSCLARAATDRTGSQH